ncbi:aspartyl aminopeptidase, partial [Reticulomyxa filosa]
CWPLNLLRNQIKLLCVFYFLKKIKCKDNEPLNCYVFTHFLHCDGIQFNDSTKSPMNEDCHPMLLKLLAKELNVDPEQIHDFELYLYDTHKSCLGGALNEFIYSARLDNLTSCFVACGHCCKQTAPTALPAKQTSVYWHALTMRKLAPNPTAALLPICC